MAIFTHASFADIHICSASTITKLYFHAVTFTFTFVRLNCKFSIKHYPPIPGEAFQGVEGTDNVALKTGDNSLRKHRQSTEKEKRIVPATVHFLISENNIFFCILALLSQYFLFSLEWFLIIICDILWENVH